MTEYSTVREVCAVGSDPLHVPVQVLYCNYTVGMNKAKMMGEQLLCSCNCLERKQDKTNRDKTSQNKTDGQSGCHLDWIAAVQGIIQAHPGRVHASHPGFIKR